MLVCPLWRRRRQRARRSLHDARRRAGLLPPRAAPSAQRLPPRTRDGGLTVGAHLAEPTRRPPGHRRQAAASVFWSVSSDAACLSFAAPSSAARSLASQSAEVFASAAAFSASQSASASSVDLALSLATSISTSACILVLASSSAALRPFSAARAALGCPFGRIGIGGSALLRLARGARRHRGHAAAAPGGAASGRRALPSSACLSIASSAPAPAPSGAAWRRLRSQHTWPSSRPRHALAHA